MKIVIDNLKTLSKNFGCLWSAGFISDVEGGKYVLRSKGIVEKQTDSSSTSNFMTLAGFTKRDETSIGNWKYIWAIANSGGRLWKFGENDPTALTNVRTPAEVASYNPDIYACDNNDIIWTQARYLGLMDSSGVNSVTFTGSGLNDATSGGTYTGSAIVSFRVEIDATGTPDTFKWSNDGGSTWEATGVSITGSAQTLENGVTITFAATTGHTLGDRWDFTTGTYNETYGDFTSGLDSSYNATSLRRPIIPFEDLILIGNKDYLAYTNNNGASFNAAYKQLPQKYEVSCGAGNGSYVLIGANKFSSGALFLWDTTSDGWNNKIYLDNGVYSIKPYKNGWVFVAGGGLYYTNGWSVSLLDYLPDASYKNGLSINFNGMEVIDDNVVFGGSISIYGALKGGFYIYNIKTKIFDFIPLHNGNLIPTPSSVYFNIGNSQIYVSYQYNDATTKYALSTLDFITHRINDRSYYITRKILAPKNTKITKIGLNISIDKSYTNNYSTKSADITIRLANASSKMWTYAQARVTSSNANEIEIDGTKDGYNKGSVGDQVLILEGVNSFESAHISSITNQGTATEKWTLDASLTGNTEASTDLNVLPFKKFGKKTITDAGYVEFYNNQKLTMSDQFYVQIQIDNTYFPITINEIIVEYEQPR